MRCATVSRPSTSSASATARMPARERLIESSTRPWLWPCRDHRRGVRRGSRRGSSAWSRELDRCRWVHVLVVMTHGPEQIRDAVVVQRVEDMPTVAPRTHEPQNPQQPQVVRRRAQAQPGGASEVLDRLLAVRQLGQDTQASGGRKRAERLGELLRLLCGEWPSRGAVLGRMRHSIQPTHMSKYSTISLGDVWRHVGPSASTARTARAGAARAVRRRAGSARPVIAPASDRPAETPIAARTRR